MKTVVLYAHYDGSPVSAVEWTTAPFKPVLRSGPIERRRADNSAAVCWYRS